MTLKEMLDNLWDICDDCGGTGRYDPSAQWRRCHYCNGTGKIVKEEEKGVIEQLVDLLRDSFAEKDHTHTIS